MDPDHSAEDARAPAPFLGLKPKKIIAALLELLVDAGHVVLDSVEAYV